MVAGIFYLWISMSAMLWANPVKHEMKIPMLRFAGVHALTTHDGEARGYFSLYAESNGVWKVHFFDTQINEIGVARVEAPRHSFYNTACTDGEHVLLSFLTNIGGGTATYVLLGMDGNQIASETRSGVSGLNRGEEFWPRLFALPGEGFLIAETVGRGRRSGYRLELIDLALRSQWKQDFYSDNGSAQLYRLMILADRLLLHETAERAGKTRSNEIHQVNPRNGMILSSHFLHQDGYSYFPTAMVSLGEDRIMMAGTYYRGEEMRTRNTRGLFFQVINGKGELVSRQNYEWSELRPLLRTQVYDWFFKVMPEVWIHAIEKTDDGRLLALGELYRYSGEVSHFDGENSMPRNSYHRIRILDFMLFDLDQEGVMHFAERIERPHMVLNLDAGSGGSGSLGHRAGQGALSRARALKEKGALTYRFHRREKDGTLSMGFMSYEAKTHYAYVMNLEGRKDYVQSMLVHAKPRFISNLEMAGLCAGQSGFGFILTEMNTRSFDDSEAYWRGLLPSDAGSLVTYEYMPLGGKLIISRTDL